MLSPTVCDVSERPIATGVSPSVKALSVGCISQWAAEPRGVASLITAGVVLQRWRVTHSTITVRIKTKDEGRSPQPLQQICCLTMKSETSYYSCVSISLLLSYTTYNPVCTCRAEAHIWSYERWNLKASVEARNELCHQNSSADTFIKQNQSKAKQLLVRLGLLSVCKMHLG